jgi:hypothetical protein
VRGLLGHGAENKVTREQSPVASCRLPVKGCGFCPSTGN